MGKNYVALDFGPCYIILPTEGVASFHNSHIIISPSFPNETFDCNSIEM